jgi:gamma-glutamylcyclotransferase (GGCT)/AIG2-like uncharacterized protein YtfP
MDFLFAYGTLVPPDASRREDEGWTSDAVRGRLYDLGPYPGLVDLDNPTAGWIEGFVRVVDILELVGRLDPYEGVDEGLYRRERVTTRSGVRAWIYVYNRPLPGGARGPLARWEGWPEPSASGNLDDPAQRPGDDRWPRIQRRPPRSTGSTKSRRRSADT